MNRTHTLTLMLLAGVGLVGCAGSGAHPQADHAVSNAESVRVAPDTHAHDELAAADARLRLTDDNADPTMQATPHLRFLGTSREGRPIECYDIGAGPTTILFLATIHGNEPAGTPLMHALHDLLAEHPELVEGRRVLMVPCLNPDGYQTSHRHNARGVDLNRNFPARNWRTMRTSGEAPASEPETEIILALIDRTSPDRIITFHQPLACIDYDGPAVDLAHAMADACDLPVRKLGARNGSLGAYAGETLGIPIITVEFARDAHRRSDDELWNQYRAMLEAAIAWHGP